MSENQENPELSPDDIRGLVRKRGRHSLRLPNLTLGPRRRSEYDDTAPLHAQYKRPRRALRVLGISLFTILVLVVSTAGFLYYDLSNRVANAEIAVEEFIDDEGPREPIDDYSGRALNVLLLGTDTRVGEGNDRYGAEEGDESMRSDIAIVAHISEDRKTVQMISIPRDTWTTIPSCRTKDGMQTSPQEGQFNWAMSVGSENVAENLDTGIACVWRTVEELTGLKIDEFVLFDFAGFEQMINALGGVNMCFDEDLYDEQAELDIKAGCHTLNGHDALAYARARKAVGDGSDISRIGRQQELMGRIFHTAMTKNMLTDFPKLYSFVSETLGTINTSSNLARLNTSAGLAYSLAGLPSDGLQFVTMPFAEAPWDPNRVVPTWQADEVWEAIKEDKPLPTGIEITDSRGNKIVLEDEPAETDENGNPVPQETDENGNPVTGRGPAGTGQNGRGING